MFSWQWGGLGADQERKPQGMEEARALHGVRSSGRELLGVGGVYRDVGEEESAGGHYQCHVKVK